MIYQAHGLTTQMSYINALSEARIAISSYVAPEHITTDVICTVDTTKHDSEIRADERRKFAEWLEDNDYLLETEYSYGEQIINFRTAKSIIDEYENAQADKEDN